MSSASAYGRWAALEQITSSELGYTYYTQTKSRREWIRRFELWRYMFDLYIKIHPSAKESGETEPPTRYFTALLLAAGEWLNFALYEGGFRKDVELECTRLDELLAVLLRNLEREK